MLCGPVGLSESVTAMVIIGYIHELKPKYIVQERIIMNCRDLRGVRLPAGQVCFHRSHMRRVKSQW